MIPPRTRAQLAFHHGWNARLAEELVGGAADGIPGADLDLIDQSLGLEHLDDARAGWQAAGDLLAAREMISQRKEIPGNARKSTRRR